MKRVFFCVLAAALLLASAAEAGGLFRSRSRTAVRSNFRGSAVAVSHGHGVAVRQQFVPVQSYAVRQQIVPVQSYAVRQQVVPVQSYAVQQQFVPLGNGCYNGGAAILGGGY